MEEIMPPPRRACVADVGAGGGYPGLPLALVRPDLTITLIERAARKAEYLRLAARELALPNVTVVTGQAEEVAPAAFDVACAKAIGPAGAAFPAVWRLVRPGGRAVFFTTAAAEKAIAEVSKKYNAGPAERRRYHLPGLREERLLVAYIREEVSRETARGAAARMFHVKP